MGVCFERLFVIVLFLSSRAKTEDVCFVFPMRECNFLAFSQLAQFVLMVSFPLGSRTQGKDLFILEFRYCSLELFARNCVVFFTLNFNFLP